MEVALHQGAGGAGGSAGVRVLVRGARGRLVTPSTAFRAHPLQQHFPLPALFSSVAISLRQREALLSQVAGPRRGPAHQQRVWGRSLLDAEGMDAVGLIQGIPPEKRRAQVRHWASALPSQLVRPFTVGRRPRSPCAQTAFRCTWWPSDSGKRCWDRRVPPGCPAGAGYLPPAGTAACVAIARVQTGGSRRVRFPVESHHRVGTLRKVSRRTLVPVPPRRRETTPGHVVVERRRARRTRRPGMARTCRS